MVKKYISTIKKVIYRNRINLNRFDIATKPREVNLHWWRMRGNQQNIGDFLSPVVVEYMKECNKITNNKSSGRNKHLYAIGSIIDGGYQNATIWGSGLMTGDRKYWWRYFRKLDIRCVRGPESRRVLIDNGYDCPECYGDPALLMPLIYSPKNSEKKYQYRVIQHYIYDNPLPESLNPLTNDWKGFVDELVQSELIISSSLHGIILAEAYGIPAILLRRNMKMFKYYDYYYSTGRFDFPIVDSVDEALRIRPAQLPDLQELRRNLLNSFPCDLWSE